MKKEELKTEILKKPLPRNIAIILDGNGRWAKKRAMPRTFGHAKGIDTLVKISEVAHNLGIENLLVYAFSTENWSRPKEEVDFLMKALVSSLKKYKKRVIKNQTRIKVIGEKNNLSKEILDTIAEIENDTAHFTSFTLGICFNYGGQQEIVHAAKEIALLVKDGNLNIDDITPQLFEQHLYTKEIGPIDLLIRTSGEERTSNFLPWQLAYSEFIFTPVLWPDFNEKELYLSIQKYQNRNRRFGGLKEDAK